MADFNSFQKRVISGLQNKKAEARCPICGTESWQVSREPVAIGDTDLKGYFPAAALICNNCGFVRMHLLAALNIEFPLAAETAQSEQPPETIQAIETVQAAETPKAKEVGE